jgi:hypothetical protein
MASPKPPRALLYMSAIFGVVLRTEVLGWADPNTRSALPNIEQLRWNTDPYTVT